MALHNATRPKATPMTRGASSGWGRRPWWAHGSGWKRRLAERPDVVLAAPAFDEDLGLGQGGEDLRIETLVAQREASADSPF